MRGYVIDGHHTGVVVCGGVVVSFRVTVVDR